MVSPDQFKCKLNLAGSSLRRSDESRTGDRVTSLVEDLKIVGRRGEICVVKNIEKLHSELSLKSSEIRFTRLFLKTEKSTFDKPGPN